MAALGQGKLQNDGMQGLGGGRWWLEWRLTGLGSAELEAAHGGGGEGGGASHEAEEKDGRRAHFVY